MRTSHVWNSATILTLCLFSETISAQNNKPEPVISCKLGETQSASILRDHQIDDTYIYYLKQQETSSLLFDDNEDESRGSEVKVRCAENKERVLIVYGEFSSNYIKGLALRYNQKSAKWERIDFAERAGPVRVYMNDHHMSVVIPNKGNETNKKFLIYNYESGKGQSEENAVANSLPPADGQHVIIINK